MTGYATSVPILSVGQRLYRGVLWDQKPSNIQDISYPPPHVVNFPERKQGRANRSNESKFYCSVGRNAPFFELNNASPKPSISGPKKRAYLFQRAMEEV